MLADGDTLALGLLLILADGETDELGDTDADKLFDILFEILGDNDGLNTFTLLLQSASICSHHVKHKLPSLSSAYGISRNK